MSLTIEIPQEDEQVSGLINDFTGKVSDALNLLT